MADPRKTDPRGTTTASRRIPIAPPIPRPSPLAEPAAPAARSSVAAASPGSASLKIARDPGAVTLENVVDAAGERKPYLKMAFANPYNLSLLAGGLAAAALTLNPIPALVAGGLEALWLVWAPDNSLLQRRLWDPRLTEARRSALQAERSRRMSLLDPTDADRVERLSHRREEIASLAAQNPSFTGELLRGELSKADRLVDSFLDLALQLARHETYLASVDPRQLQAEVDKYAEAVRRGAPEDPATAIYRKNLEVVVKRQERMREIQKYVSLARGQLDLIEHSFDLIADQIVTMQSPRELSGQLDDLLDGVEAIRETARDTEAILGSLDRDV